MTAATQRSISRWIHILFALPLIGFIYGPAADVEPYRAYFQYLYFPVVALSGLWMWKGHLVTKLFKADTKQ